MPRTKFDTGTTSTAVAQRVKLVPKMVTANDGKKVEVMEQERLDIGTTARVWVYVPGKSLKDRVWIDDATAFEYGGVRVAMFRSPFAFRDPRAAEDPTIFRLIKGVVLKGEWVISERASHRLLYAHSVRTANEAYNLLKGFVKVLGGKEEFAKRVEDANARLTQ